MDLVLLLVFFTFSGLLHQAIVHGESVPLAPALFVFGDSLTDNGNNNYIPTIARANYPPYGIDFGSPTGRFCNGLTAVDYGGRILGLPLIPPYLGPSSRRHILNGLNYASAAAGILDETGSNYGAKISFSGQILLFQKTVPVQLPPFFQTLEALRYYLAKSIFLINIGSNDYINNYLLPTIYTSRRMYNGDQFADLLISSYSRQIASLYRLGARKMVLTGMGPLGCIPSQLSMVNDNNNGCVDSVNSLVNHFNGRLLQLSQTLNASLPGAFFVYQDTYSFFMDLINNPSQYGFSVSNKACCGNGRYGGTLTCLPLQPPCVNRDEYIFWDSFHPTQAVNSIVAERCYGANASDCYPISISELAQM